MKYSLYIYIYSIKADVSFKIAPTYTPVSQRKSPEIGNTIFQQDNSEITEI